MSTYLDELLIWKHNKNATTVLFWSNLCSESIWRLMSQLAVVFLLHDQLELYLSKWRNSVQNGNVNTSSKIAKSQVVEKNRRAGIESHNYGANTKLGEFIQNDETAKKRSASPRNPTFFRLRGMKKQKSDSNTKSSGNECVISEARLSPVPFESHRQSGSEVDFNLELFDFGIILS